MIYVICVCMCVCCSECVFLMCTRVSLFLNMSVFLWMCVNVCLCVWVCVMCVSLCVCVCVGVHVSMSPRYLAALSKESTSGEFPGFIGFDQDLSVTLSSLYFSQHTSDFFT